MITLRRSEQRHHDRNRTWDVWLTFHSEDRADALADGFNTLESLDEGRVPPGASVERHPRHEAEVVTYVHEGALAYEDSMGRSGIILAGEFQRMTAGPGGRYGEANPSPTAWAHVFQIWLSPSELGLGPSHEEKRFCVSDRRGGLLVVASPDARSGSLRIHHDGLVYSALLEPGQHVVHELSEGRSAWLHLVQGEVILGDIVLSEGDGVGISAERAVSLTARKKSEILLFDLGTRARSRRRGELAARA